jgi:hypothetical protein
VLRRASKDTSMGDFSFAWAVGGVVKHLCNKVFDRNVDPAAVGSEVA